MAKRVNIVISKRLVAINSASTLLARVVNFIVLLWVYQYLLKNLPVDQFAVLPLVTSLMVFGPLFFSFFIGGIARYMIDEYAKGNFEETRRVASSIFPILVGFSAILLPLGLIFSMNIEKVFNIAPSMVGDARTMLTLLIVSFIFQMIVVPFTTAYAISQRYVEKSLLEVTRDLFRALLTVALLLALGPKVLFVVIATVVSEILIVSIMLRRSFIIVPQLWFEWRLFSLSQAYELMSFGLWTTLGRLGSVMYTHAATLILNLYGTATDVTAYHIGATFFRQTQSTINLASTPMQPAITAMNALEQRAKLQRAVFRGGRYALWVSMLLATPLMVFASNFIELYLGADFSIAAKVLVLFMIIFPFTHPTILLPITAMATKDVRAFFLPAFLFQFSGLLLMLLFATRLEMGVIGVTLSLTIVSIGSQLLYFWKLCVKLTRSNFSAFAKSTFLLGLTPTFAGLTIWLPLKLFIDPDTWFDLVTCSIFGALAYCVALFRYCLNSSERADLSNLINKTKVLFKTRGF